ncbi:MAG: PKD domain-containing protein, partial [Ilumatobacteraceae bacterium]
MALAVPAPAVRAAQPEPNHSGLVPDLPRTNTPRITTGEITDLEAIGNRIFIAGSFNSIQNNASGNNTTYNQRYLASFNVNTGLVDSGFRPTFGGGGVTEIEASPDGSRLYVVGRFDSVNGVTKRRIAAIDATTGATINAFTANADAAATAVDATSSTVYVGGQFSTVNGAPQVGLVALNATTGAVVPSFDNDLSGGIGVAGLLTVQALKLSHDDSRLLVVHTGRQVAGQDRQAAALIDTSTNQLLPWRTRLWDENLQFIGGITRVYAADISPDDSYFVVTSGSGGDRPPISDTAVAFPMSGNDDVDPLWISRLFDSVYSVAITEQAVYIGGHFNYMESPTAPDPWPGLDNVGYGRGQGLAGYGLGDDIVIREHVGALNPVDGKALEWNPTSDSYEGNKAMLATPRGIVTGGDAISQGGYNIGRIAFYDFDSVPAPGANETTIVNPIEGRVEESDVEFVIDGQATASSGVNRVQLEIQDRDSLRYLQDDLVTWGSWNAINANLASPGASSTAWSLPLTFSGNHRYQVLARTFGNNGSRDATKASKKFETFGLADETPSTRITDPRWGEIVPTTTFIVGGTANDDVGVNSVTLTFRDAQNRYLQDDGTVDVAYNSFRADPDVVGAASATWSYEVTLPYEGEWTAQAIAVDTAGQSDLRSADATWLVSETAIEPTVSISEPAIMIPPTTTQPLVVTPGAPITFAGSATDDEGLDYVEISLRNSATREVLAADGTWGTDVIAGWHRISPATSLAGTSYNWSYTTPFDLRPGVYTFSVRAFDDLGIPTSRSNRGSLTINSQVEGDAFPDGALNVTGTVTGLQDLHLDLAGTAIDDIGVSAVRVNIQERDSRLYVQPDGSLGSPYALLDATLAAPGAISTTWTLPIDLPGPGDYSVTAFAYDTSDQQDPTTSGATASYPIYPGDLPPVVDEGLLAPTDGTLFPDGRIIVSGRFEDDQQMAEGHVALRNSLGQYMSRSGTFSSTSPYWNNVFLTSQGSPGSNFSYTSPVLPAGEYTVLVRGEDQHGFTTDPPIERTVTVEIPAGNLPPVADFTYSCVENVCSFDARTSTDENAPALSYSWDFGQGSGSGPVPTKTYTAPSPVDGYVVTLTVTDEWNEIATVQQTLTIVTPTGNLPPVPVINPPSCADLSCNFSAVGTEDPNDGDTVSLVWDFGDGTPTSTSTSLSHAFPAGGTYLVSLTATDGWESADTTTFEITVVDPTDPPGNVAPVASIDAPVCVMLDCTFTGTVSDTDGTVTGYSWVFGDGSTAEAGVPGVDGVVSAAHTFASPGHYVVVLTATDDLGTSGLDTQAVDVVGNEPPTAAFTQGCTDLVCTFDASGSTDVAPGTIVEYSWDWGDGSPVETGTPLEHTYATFGDYTIVLTVTDDGGATGTTEQTITVGTPPPPPPNEPPVAVATASCTDLTCTFDGSASADVAPGAIVGYSWDFGDGTTGDGAVVEHVYAADGDYTATLTVTDDEAATGVDTESVSVSEPPPPPPPADVELRAANGTTSSGATASVTIPATVQDGDQMLFFVTANVATSASTPDGWTLLGTEEDGSPDIRTWVFTRIADATTGGSTVVSTLGTGSGKSTRLVLAYSG